MLIVAGSCSSLSAVSYETINRVANCESKYVFSFSSPYSECDARLKIKIQSTHFDGIQHIINFLVLSTKQFCEATRTAIFWSFCSRPRIAIRIQKIKMIKSSNGGGGGGGGSSWMNFYFSNDWMPLNVGKKTAEKCFLRFVCSLRIKAWRREGRTGSLCSTLYAYRVVLSLPGNF